MTKVNVHEAKSQLSKLIELAKNGEEVIIAKNGKPEARLTAYEPERKSWVGMDAGKIWIADDFDEWPQDMLELMSDPKIFPDENGPDDENSN
ncbi:MAG: type II toxin-antitoxin system Phd/YefM family antitoxin [Chloracidobacterium sp.]|nr:type II toxin-antitoxin system Phd/YefM family antitoxin [Chloracidobacterium sp.]